MQLEVLVQSRMVRLFKFEAGKDRIVVRKERRNEARREEVYMHVLREILVRVGEMVSCLYPKVHRAR